MDAILDILEDLKPGEDYRSRTDLVDARVLDSLTILALVSELEETFDIAIPAVEIVAENFNSLEGMWAMVCRLQEESF
ncbi:phosphopantetheine-binding protein [Candidatus Collinsella stercoripullorum]|uniref:phosphopantetheine-binding protein n=1 Tax=Candidatus Collinsella stercoripullorum TaxID=2838522 RepID=UPI001C3AD983|nr:phosphopantetheine-binding protein [Candidatus Collinsella stercoripullorum]HJA00638.1 acyl carrier protein [Candidatus Collinsella stercoripullorum]